MIGIVLVSHSVALAEAARDLALQMVHGVRPEIRIAAGAEGGFGTDAAAIAEALDDLGETDGVLILTDLGSAVMSSSLALDIRESTQPVLISDGPFVEGATAAVVGAAAGSSLEAAAAEARGALQAKQPAPSGASEQAASTDDVDAPAERPEGDRGDGLVADERLVNPLGIHSRPAAMLVKTVSSFDSRITLTNTSAGKGPANAASLVGLLALGAGKDDSIRIEAEGADAGTALVAVRQLIADGFGET